MRSQLEIKRKTPKQLLNKASGFLADYTHTLNPYAGCAYSCSYCYVRQMPIALFRGQEWGTWVDVKEQAAEQLRKELIKAKKKGPVRIFMSSSTDPYQPLEHKEQVTRSLLEVMVEEPPDYLFVQTRSPLVVRDLDLFAQLKDRIRISITIETDLEEIREAFTPLAPSIHARLTALQKVVDAHLPAQATIAPMLPSSEEFPRLLKKVAPRICIDDFFMGDGSGGKRTERLGIRALYQQLGLEEWYDKGAYLRVVERLKQEFRDEQILVSSQGFTE